MTPTPAAVSRSAGRLPLLNPQPSIQSASYLSITSSLTLILSNAIQISSHSWEIGSLSEVLLEVYNPDLTLFHPPRPGVNVPWEMLSVISGYMERYDFTASPSSASKKSQHYIDRPISSRTDDVNLTAYLDPATSPTKLISRVLMDGEGALGDPCSLGTSAWMLAEYSKDLAVRDRLGAKAPEDYAWAVGNQLLHLHQGISSPNGTISQREEYFELWSDQGNMIPPFLAYLGLASSNCTLLKAGIDQMLLLSSAHLDPSVNLFRHIPAGDDPRFWSTGCGWMLRGIVKLMATIKAADQKTTLHKEFEELVSLASAVFGALFDQLDSESLIPNYVLYTTQDEGRTIGETAGTALILSAYYRFVQLCPERANYIYLQTKVEKAFNAVVSKVNSTGWLTQVVDPLGTNGLIVDSKDSTRFQSPEGQSFLGMLWAARTALGV